MRITFVLPVLGISGGLKVLSTYADRLTRRGHEVHVVAPPLRPFGTMEALRLLSAGKYFSTRRNFRGQIAQFTAGGAKVRVLDSYRDVSAADVPDGDVVIATWWRTAEWVAGLPATKGVKVNFLQGYDAWESQPKDRVDAAWRLPMHKVTISSWLAGIARERFGDASVDIVPNAVDTTQFDAPARGKQGVFTVGFIHSPLSIKGTDVMIRAVEIARMKRPGMRIVSFGTMPPKPNLYLPAGSEFTLSPAQDLIPMLYASADCWLLASRQEGFGLPILEASACRTPVISTPAGAASELLSDGRGMLVPFDDVRAMAEAVERVGAMSGAEWRAMSDRAYAATRAHGWDEAAGRFEAALRRAIARVESGELPAEIDPGVIGVRALEKGVAS